MVDAGVVVDELLAAGEVAAVEGAVAVLAALLDVQVVAEPMGTGRGGPDFEFAGRGLLELVVSDVVGGAVFVLDDLQTEVGVFAEVGGHGPVVQALGSGVTRGPEDDLGLGFPAEDDEVLRLGCVGAGREVMVDEDGLVQRHAIGNEHGTAILWRSGLQGGEPLVVGEVVGFEGGQALRTGFGGVGQGRNEQSVGVYSLSADIPAVDEGEPVGVHSVEYSWGGVGVQGRRCQGELLDAGDAGVFPAFVTGGGVAEAIEGGECRGLAAWCHVDLAC